MSFVLPFFSTPKTWQPQLMQAIAASNPQAVQQLLRAKHDVNFSQMVKGSYPGTKSIGTHTPLTTAIEHCSPQDCGAIVELLLKAGANPSQFVMRVRTGNGVDFAPATALSLSVEHHLKHGMDQVYAQLRKAGGEIFGSGSLEYNKPGTEWLRNPQNKIRARLQSLGVDGVWQEWETNFQNQQCKSVLSKELEEIDAPIRRLKI